MTKLVQGNSKVIVKPVIHQSYSGTRRTWAASVVLRTDESDYGNPDNRVDCGHENHPTTDAAVKCGVTAWKRLPK